jgi:CubicO group peptidase (beta-lactamase class C family)
MKPEPTRAAMRRLRHTSAVLFALVIPAAATAQVPADHAVRVDRIFAEWDLATSPGCAVGVAWDGLTVLERAYGMANLEFGIPNSPNTIFEAGSVSKQFTAAATTLLAMDGSLSIDDDVRAYIPEVPDYGETIRIRHMLNHTSGLRDWGSVAGISGWGRGARTHDHGHMLDIVSRQTRLNFEPGYEYSYSNTGYNLQAVMISRVSGMSFRDFSAERIFEPLGLDDTQWRDDYRRIVPGRATAYSPGQGGFRINQPIEDVHGNGGLLTTVGDLLTWARSFDEGRLAGPEFVQRMETQGVLTSGATIAYAAGLSVGDMQGVRSVTHTGSTAGYRAYLGRFYPEGHTLAVALLCNVSNANPGGLGGQVARVYLEEMLGPPTAVDVIMEDAVAVPEARLRAFVGTYARDITGQPAVVELEQGRLSIAGAPMYARSETEFAVGGSPDQVARFESTGGGRPTLVRMTSGYEVGRFLPVDAWSPSASDLEAFVGSYHSDDAETTLTVTLEDGTLYLERYPNPVRGDIVPAVYADAFDEGSIRFRRDASGRVVEISRYAGRVYDMRYQRVDGR